jgi:hypothetical protein
MNHLILAAAIAGLALSPAALAQETLTESSCHIVTNDGANPVPLIGVSILNQTAAPGAFSLNMPDDMAVDGLLCFRSSAIPGPNDWEVVTAGYPLYITERRESGRDVTTLLEISDSQFRIRIIDGALSAEDRNRAAQRLESYYAAVNSGM